MYSIEELANDFRKLGIRLARQSCYTLRCERRDAFQIEREIPCRLKALHWLLLQTPPHHPIHRRRNRLARLAQLRRILFQNYSPMEASLMEPQKQSQPVLDSSHQPITLGLSANSPQPTSKRRGGPTGDPGRRNFTRNSQVAQPLLGPCPPRIGYCGAMPSLTMKR